MTALCTAGGLCSKSPSTQLPQLCAIYMLLVRWAIFKETGFKLQRPIAFDGSFADQSPGTATAEQDVLYSAKEGLASTEGEEPLGCTLCILCTTLLKFCSAISCAVFGRRQLSMQHGPAFLQWKL